MKPFLTLALALLLVPAALAIWPGDPGFRGCVIADTQHGGQFDDVDCDRVPDVYDNCPFVSNGEQADRDENGYGDACDLVIDEIRLEPDTPLQGRSVLITPFVMNNRQYPMRNLEVKVEIPALGLSTTEGISILQPGERLSVELITRIPECAPARFTDFVIIVEYPYAPGQKEVFSQGVRAPVQSSGLCAQENPNLDTTIVNILEVQDVDPVDGALYPFTIHNNFPESRAYILSIDLLDEWGYSEIHPGSLIVIPPGETRDGALQVWAHDGVPEGERTFLFTVQAKDDTRQIQLIADVKGEASRPLPPAGELAMGFLVFAVVLVAILVVVHYVRAKHRHRR